MNKLWIIAISLVLILGSCAKDGEDGIDGKDGQTGIAGANGTDGQDGQDGQGGVDGQDGNANVKSITKIVHSSDWQESGTMGESNFSYVASIPVSEITTSINETGMVMVYQFYNNINMALPMTATYDGYTKHIDYAYGVGEVAIIIKDSDLYTLSPSSDITYRIVIIEGSVMSRNTDVDFNNYQEVKTVFNLKD